MSFTVKGKPLDYALLQETIPTLKKLSSEMKGYAQTISPTDTKEYIRNRKEDGIKITNKSVEFSISNNTSYAWILETGVKGKVYNYHKGPPRNPSTVIYSGVGNRTAQRTLDFISKKI